MVYDVKKLIASLAGTPREASVVAISDAVFGSDRKNLLDVQHTFDRSRSILERLNALGFDVVKISLN